MSKRRALRGSRKHTLDDESASPELLRRKVAILWTRTDDQAMAWDLLGTYAGNEPDRVKLAIVKLSEGKLAELERYVKAAQLDYRDVLLWAEYPHAARVGPATRHDDDEARARRADAQRLDALQYREWLKKKE